MSLLESDALLDLLLQHRLISEQQKKFVLRNKERQRQHLRKLQLEHKLVVGRGYPDMADIVTSMKLELPGGDKKLLTEEMVMRTVAHHLKIPFKKLDPLELDIQIVTKTIPRSFAINHLILPFEVRNGVLQVVTYDPENRSPLDDIEQVNQIKVNPWLSTRSDIRKILSEFFGFQQSITAAEQEFSSPGTGPSVDIGNLEQYVKLSSTELSSTDQHIKAAVNHLFKYAIEQRASDIHIEPKREACLVRYRIDGILHTIYKLPKAVHSAITSRIKALARLDIAEKRRPQDGRIKISQQDGKEVELRISTIPVSFGEKTVMRILDTSVIFQDIDEMGFSKRDRAIYNSLMTAQHGLVFVTGPTGSGKSTTLYSTLKKISTPEINIITVEDPVEMVHEDFNQIAVQPQIDVTFSTILRNILRQDPDVIMIGEIRDFETATHAVQAALTGHLVFSTLHTNDAVSTVIRLQDLGLEPFLISSTMLGALAQRLVRKICPYCITGYEEDLSELQRMGFPVSGEGKIELKRGKGCKECRKTGYAGRMGIFELFPMSDRLKKLVTEKAADAELRQAAIREGMTTLKEDAWLKVKNGLTTVEEVLRVCGDA